MRLLTLGALRLEGSGTKFRRTKSLLLLAYLAIEGPKARRELAERFYFETKDPRDSLSAALAKIKKAAPDAFDADNNRVWTSLDCDAKDILNNLEQGNSKAIELYQGAFLEGLDLSLGEELEEWVFSTREYLAAQVRERYLQEAEKLLPTDVSRAGQYAEFAYTLVGAPELNPEDFPRVYHFLKISRNPLSARVLEDAESYGIELKLDVDLVQAKFVVATETQHKQPQQLPQMNSSFIGRDPERLAIADLLSESHCHLITLFGPGGVGKTRLALQAAYDQLKESKFADGVFFVPLDALSSADEIPTSIASAIGISLEGAENPLIPISNYLTHKDVLLILDNFEHLSEAIMIPASILKDCPNLKVIITSRERLHLTEEHVLNLSGLDLPSPNTKTEDLPYVESIQLFLQRAKKATLAFTLDDESMPHVIGLVQMVEGYPLAIELAAAWVRVLPLAEIVKEVNTNLDFLSSVSPNINDRHKSIRAAFNYSWQLLSKKDQDVLSKLSVFRGGFSRGAASEVADASLSSLVSLIDKSLLRVSAKGRFDRHALLFQYTQEKLAEQAELELLTLEKHAAYFLSLAKEIEPKLYTAEQATWFERLDIEFENLQLAQTWFLEHIKPNQALSFAASLGHFWTVRGYFKQGRRWLDRILNHPDTQEPTDLRAMVLRDAGNIAKNQKDYASANSFYKQSLSLCQKLADKRGMAISLNNLGMIAKLQYDYSTAKPLYEECLRIFRELGETRGVAGALNNLGNLAHNKGEASSALPLYQESLRIFQDIGDHYGIAHAFFNLADLAIEQNNYTEAQMLLKESLAVSQKIGDKVGIASCLDNLALLLADNLIQEAVHFWASAEMIRESMQTVPLYTERLSTAIKKVRTNLGEEAFLAYWKQGKNARLAQVIELALSTNLELKGAK